MRQQGIMARPVARKQHPAVLRWHALMLSPPTKFDEGSIPAPIAAFPQLTDALHRRRYSFPALVLYSTGFLHFITPPRAFNPVVICSARSPLCRNREYLVVYFLQVRCPGPYTASSRSASSSLFPIFSFHLCSRTYPPFPVKILTHKSQYTN